MQSPELNPLYAKYLQERQWEAYVSSLSRDGLDWCLSMDVPTLAAHLNPLQGLPKEIDVPERISILSAACRMDGPLEDIDGLFEKFLVQKDHDAAVAAAVTAIFTIMNSGRDFRRFESWDERIAGLLKTPDGLSPLALAAAIGGRGFIQTIYFGDYIEAARSLRKAIFKADAAPSVSLKLWYSIHICFCYLSMGDLAMLDIVLFDIAPSPDAVVSIHDVAGTDINRITAILDFLSSMNVARVTLLVIPGSGWDDAGRQRLRQWGESGIDLAAHGLRHRCGRIWEPYHRFHSRFLSRNVARHLSAGLNRVADIIRRSHDWFEEMGLPTIPLYVPPAGTMGRIDETALRKLPFRLYETVTGVWYARTGRRR